MTQIKFEFLLKLNYILYKIRHLTSDDILY